MTSSSCDQAVSCHRLDRQRPSGSAAQQPCRSRTEGHHGSITNVTYIVRFSKAPPAAVGRLRALVTAMARLDLPFAQASSARSHPVPAHRVSDLQDLKNDRLSV